MDRTDFDYDPKRDKLPSPITWILIAMSVGAAIYLSMILV